MLMDRMEFTMKLMEGLEANVGEQKDLRGTQDTATNKLGMLL